MFFFSKPSVLCYDIFWSCDPFEVRVQLLCMQLQTLKQMQQGNSEHSVSCLLNIRLS